MTERPAELQILGDAATPGARATHAWWTPRRSPARRPRPTCSLLIPEAGNLGRTLEVRGHRLVDDHDVAWSTRIAARQGMDAELLRRFTPPGEHRIVIEIRPVKTDVWPVAD